MGYGASEHALLTTVLLTIRFRKWPLWPSDSCLSDQIRIHISNLTPLSAINLAKDIQSGYKVLYFPYFKMVDILKLNIYNNVFHTLFSCVNERRRKENGLIVSGRRYIWDLIITMAPFSVPTSIAFIIYSYQQIWTKKWSEIPILGILRNKSHNQKS